ncbi:MAG: Hsp20/alpha crystallin family protein [Gammaproteobacteria bacterium]|nr:MAG: Hsp20/alpha crystallin family protein [Gammaproteobacteria bacterium]
MAEEKRQEVVRAEQGQQGRAPARVWNPFDEMERLMESFFPRGWLRPLRMGLPEWPSLPEVRIPPVDVIDRDEEVVVRAELPGVKKEDLEVSVADNTVTIRGRVQREEKQEEGEYYRAETARGEFTRTVLLPAEVDPEGAKARFQDGVLELTLPKVAKARRRTIPVE